MATTSVSKGCFVFKPNFKKRKISVPIEDYFNKGEKASEDSKLRFETYQLIWQQMKSETERLQEELNKNLFDSLIEFLQTSHSGLQKNSKDWSCQIKLREIPTAALVLGVNVTDHDLTLRSLTEVLQNNVTPYVVSLQAKDCPDMKHFLQKLVSQLMDCKVDVQSKEKESDRVTQKNVHYSMDSLSAWYMSVTQKADPKMLRKKRTSSCQCQSPPVVLILKDMESFTTKVLQDFIIISSQHLHEFPLILIFGIATSPVVIHRLLPHAVSSLLCIELFQSLSCKEHLTTVLDKLLLTTQFPFKLSEKVLQTLTNIFLYHDFSIQNFIKGLQLSLLEHFYSQPLSVLCCNLPEAKRRIRFLSANQCENIRRLPSFRRYVEKQSSEKQVALLTSDKSLKELEPRERSDVSEVTEQVTHEELEPRERSDVSEVTEQVTHEELEPRERSDVSEVTEQVTSEELEPRERSDVSEVTGQVTREELEPRERSDISEVTEQEETQSLLENLHVYHTKYFLVLRCLHHFTSSLPKYPLGRQIRELYCMCLEKNIWDSEEYASVLQLLRLLAKDELMAMLQNCLKVFQSSSAKELGNTAKKIEEFLAQFQSLDETKEEEETSQSQSKGLQKTDLYHLQKSLLEMKELRSASKRQTRFEVLREQVVSFVDSLAREYLLPPDTQPLHETLYFSSAHALRQHLNASPRVALHTALNNPYYYLKNEALRSEEGCIPNVAPDICIAYKLHLECSRLINLVDWSEAFATVVTAAEELGADSVTSEERGEVTHARFIRAVSELELLGFIKPTKQKTDHVARLTWGGC